MFARRWKDMEVFSSKLNCSFVRPTFATTWPWMEATGSAGTEWREKVGAQPAAFRRLSRERRGLQIQIQRLLLVPTILTTTENAPDVLIARANASKNSENTSLPSDSWFAPHPDGVRKLHFFPTSLRRQHVALSKQPLCIMLASQ